MKNDAPATGPDPGPWFGFAAAGFIRAACPACVLALFAAAINASTHEPSAVEVRTKNSRKCGLRIGNGNTPRRKDAGGTGPDRLIASKSGTRSSSPPRTE
ncbi:hypothetical protein [Glutamicibacter protophormiae]|uniref:Uncharacterized protein n=1 Tax=Glutamicibacter protophormiae TaxID=37930 RepID=A0ABS4XUY0_GLUPR|nr:hypothetical protein [Glutamicibacter protophormiae]MBP2400311.1 hypothetical protein [Glutamicibacter protophormiae]GGL93592.1 hypothetical protein GCM10010038_24390 [Glutamicibacter protophormiae]